MTRQRVYGILAGYEDQNDHDQLRSDAVFKLLAGRRPDGDDLASQPTLSRFENSVTAGDLLRLEAWCLEQFVASFKQAPTRLTLDLDVYDDPTHGQQQFTFYHGFYEQYQYLVRVFTCAENDGIAFPVLLWGTAHASTGAADDLERVVLRLRQEWPALQIHVRADSGFAIPEFYGVCERLGVDYTIGLPMNSVLKERSAEGLKQALSDFEQTSQAQRQFLTFEYQAQTWPEPRRVVVKCEANAAGTNRRAVVTNRLGAPVVPQGAYDEYADRGESENRNKELKCGLLADRLSDHRYLANCFRLYMHTLAYSLLVAVRQRVALPPDPPPAELPLEARPPEQKRKHFNQRRRIDPLGEGHAGTWRMQFIKVAARITCSTRRIVVKLSASWPYLEQFLETCGTLLAPRPHAPAGNPGLSCATASR